MPSSNIEQTPARQVVTRSPTRKVGYINCRWFQGRPIQHESNLEKQFIHVALLCPQVVWIECQPFTMKLVNGETYTPDFLLRSANGECLVVEVKTAGKVKNYHHTFNQAATQLLEKGLKFFVMTDAEICRGEVPEFCSSLLRHASAEHESVVLDRILAFSRTADSPDGIPIHRVMEECAVSSDAVFHLLAHRRLVPIHFDQRLSHSTLVKMPPAHRTGLAVAFAQHFEQEPWSAKPVLLRREKAIGLKRRVTTKVGPFLRPGRPGSNSHQTVNPLSSIAGGHLSKRFRTPSFLAAS